MRRLRHVLPLCCAPLFTSCYFLLDYDALQRPDEAPDTAGAPGQAGAPSAGSLGEAGSPGSACGDCDDHDPCTIDSCDAARECQHEPTEGLELDGFETTLASEQHVRLSLVGSGRLFYLAALEQAASGPKISLYRLASDGSALEPIGADLQLEGIPASNVGLAVEELALGEVALHGFVATKLRVGAAARVFHLVNRDGKTTSNLAGASYIADRPSLFPQALAMGDKVVGAWIQADGTIAVHNVRALKTDTFGTPSLPATTLSLLSTTNAQPAVMFTAQAAPRQAIGTYVETAGQNRAKVPECETRPGDYVSASVIGTQLPGLWLANITRAGDDYLTTGGATLLCSGNACTVAPEDCAASPPGNALRNVAGAIVHFDDDAAGVVYSVLALPQIAAKAEDASAVEAKLSLVLGRSDLNAKPQAESTTLGEVIEIARNDTDEASGFAGPDWPAVAILPGQQVAVAWIQPAETSPGTELHLQRYKMCLPAP